MHVPTSRTFWREQQRGKWGPPFTGRPPERPSTAAGAFPLGGLSLRRWGRVHQDHRSASRSRVWPWRLPQTWPPNKRTTPPWGRRRRRRRPPRRHFSLRLERGLSAEAWDGGAQRSSASAGLLQDIFGPRSGAPCMPVWGAAGLRRGVAGGWACVAHSPPTPLRRRLGRLRDTPCAVPTLTVGRLRGADPLTA